MTGSGTSSSLTSGGGLSGRVYGRCTGTGGCCSVAELRLGNSGGRGGDVWWSVVDKGVDIIAITSSG
jgi:hypothetical protein